MGETEEGARGEEEGLGGDHVEEGKMGVLLFNCERFHRGYILDCRRASLRRIGGGDSHGNRTELGATARHRLKRGSAAGGRIHASHSGLRWRFGNGRWRTHH